MTHHLAPGCTIRRLTVPFVLAAVLAATSDLASGAGNPPRLLGPHAEAGRFRFDVQSAPGTPVRLESSADLRTWESWMTTIVPASGQLSVTDPRSGAFGHRFHRAVATDPSPPSPVVPPELHFEFPEGGPRQHTNRPAIVLRTDGPSLDPASIRLRANGDSWPFVSEPAGTGLRITPLTPYPSGFVLVSVSLDDARHEIPPTTRLELTILPDDQNLPPVPEPDPAFAHAGSPKSIPVLDNDRDPNDDALRLVRVDNPEHGETRIENGRIVYLAAQGYSGPDRFSYGIEDGRGGTATGEVLVTVRAAPSFTFVVDTSALGGLRALAGQSTQAVTNSFLGAVEGICDRLAPGERGRIVVRSGEPHTVTNLVLACPIDIESEDGTEVRLQGPQITILAPVDASLVGLTFSSPSLVFVRSENSLALIRNRFSTGLHLTLAPPPTPRPATVASLHVPPGGATRLAQLVANQAPQTLVDGVVDPRGVVEVDQGEGASIEAKVHLSRDASMRVRRSKVTHLVKVEAEAEAGAHVETRATAHAGLVHNRIDASGAVEGTADSVVAGRFRVESAGNGSIEFAGRYTRTDHLALDSKAASLNYEGSDGTYGRAEVRVGTGPASARASLEATEKDTRIDGALEVGNDPDTNLRLALAKSLVRGPTTASLRGKGTLEITEDTVLEGSLGVEATTSESTKVRIDQGTVKGQVGIRKGDPSDLFFEAHLAGMLQGAHTEVGPDTPLSGRITDSHTPSGAGIDFSVALHFSQPALASAHAPPSPRRLATVAPPTQSLVISNTTFGGPSHPAAGLHLHGLRVPIEIVDCTFDNADASGIALTLTEVDAPVLVRNNRFARGVPTFDGDLEGSGRQGRIAAPYRIENNQIHAPGNLVGVPFQDLEQVRFQSNTVVAGTCLQVTAGQVVAEDNTFTGSGFTGNLTVIGQGPNGPGALVARRNRFQGSMPFSLFGGGFANFDGGNVFSPGDLFPLLILQVSGSDGRPAYARFVDNTFPVVSLVVSPDGVAYLADNTFQAGFVNDANPAGGLVVNPTRNAGITPEACATQVDFDGNGCNDLPPNCNTRDDAGDCRCGEAAVPPPVTPPWPYP